ncbi:plastocyanin [Streptomyces sp. IPPR8]|uniref:plastocyanin n=1 Tax=Streptomyces sp. IPPR8 TaxID=3417301 RepID=UPI003D699EA0
MAQSPAARATETLEKGAYRFTPNTITVAPGDTIEWVNNKAGPHNVVFDAAGVPTHDAALADSLSCKMPMVSPGQKQTTQIPADAPPGQYRFHCELHRSVGEAGTLTVESQAEHS